MIQIDYNDDMCPQQGDIYRNICITKISNVTNDDYEVEEIEIPYCVLFSQSCDLAQDYSTRQKILANETELHNNTLISTVLLPMHNFDYFVAGTHMEQFGWKIAKQERSKKKYSSWNIIKNTDPRYHYLEFAPETKLVPSILDFKHWFSMSPVDLHKARAESCYVGTLQPLYREYALQRFANYISRIGLPDDLQ